MNYRRQTVVKVDSVPLALMAKLGIAMPWRSQPTRVLAFEYVCNRYGELFPEAKIYFGDMPGDKWNISGSRNIAINAAIDDDCDVILVSDADIQPEKFSIEKAIQVTIAEKVVSLPYTETYFLNEELSSEWIAGKLSLPEAVRKSQVYRNQVAGAYVITPDIFKTMNGWDERFLGWGFEDLAFVDAHETLIGPLRKISGTLISLFHKDRDKSDADLNESRYADYKNAKGSVALMKDLVKDNRRHD